MTLNLEQVLLISIGFAFVIAVVAVLCGFVEARVRFPFYLRKSHPDIWSQLWPGGGMWRLFLPLSFDSSTRLSTFRKDGSRMRSDEQLLHRCRNANRAERTALVSVLVLFGWVIAALTAIIFLEVSKGAL